jgi:3-hydroxybutyryl-CoA dehydrogenase
MLPIETVAVVGTSEAGTTCAVLAALAGCAVRVFDASDTALERAFETVRGRVELAYAAGAITRTERQRILDGVLFTPDLDEALTGADLAVDAGGPWPEDVYAHLARALRATAAVASAAGKAAEIASRLPQPSRVLAIELADAQGAVPRVDVLPAPETSVHVLERVLAFTARVNRAWRIPGPHASLSASWTAGPSKGEK